jgi:hypothetical protein
MQKDCHYYTVLALALACGFKKKDAWTVAYASQFVDDAKINQLVFRKAPDGIEFDSKNPPALINMATCHSYSRLKTFNLAAMINNTCAFHMVPGCQGDSFAWQMVCQPYGPILEHIVEKALAEDNLVKLGMVLHPLADSYSHEGFSGLLSKPNDIQGLVTRRHPFQLDQLLPWLVVKGWRRFNRKRFDTLCDYVVPAYGHAQALNYPDISHLQWEYAYDSSDLFYKGAPKLKIAVDNRKRYEKAFIHILECLKTFLNRFDHHLDPNIRNAGALSGRFWEKILFAEISQRERVRRWRYKLKELGLDPHSDDSILNYDPTIWLSGVMDQLPPFTNYDKKTFSKREVRDADAGSGFPASHWYRFYKAVKWYKKEFHEQSKAAGLEFPHKPYV